MARCSATAAHTSRSVVVAVIEATAGATVVGAGAFVAAAWLVSVD